MSANAAQQKSHWVLAVLLLVQVVLMSAYAKHPDSEQSILRTWWLTASAPVVGTANRLLSSVTGTVGSYTDLRHAREETVVLREQIEQLTLERNQAIERSVELELLRSQLALPSRPPYREISANVIARDTSLWYRRLIIDRGTLDGVRRNMPVANGLGIIGRVISVGPNFAQIQVITDKNAGVGVMLQRSRVNGELKGLDGARCELRNIPATTDVEIGEAVVTTGLDRIYPKGLLVGTIERLENDPNAPWKKIVVNPSAQVDRVEHLLVLLVEQKDLKIDDTIK